MSVATERAAVSHPLPDGVPAEPSRFSLKHPKSRIAWIRPAVWLPLVVMLALLAGLWQWGAASMPYLLPPLQAIGDSLAGNLGYYLGNAMITLGEATAGLAIGFVAAFLVAVLISELPVARLRAAGAVIVGKTNVPELTLEGYTKNDLFGVTRNPWDRRLTPGGSSGGAASVAAECFSVEAGVAAQCRHDRHS